MKKAIVNVIYNSCAAEMAGAKPGNVVCNENTTVEADSIEEAIKKAKEKYTGLYSNPIDANFIKFIKVENKRPTLYDLNQSQQDLLNELFFDPENQKAIEKLNAIQGTAKYKLSYIGKLYQEAKATSAARKEVLEGYKKRLETAQKAEERLKDLLLQYMEAFDLKKLETDEITLRYDEGRESLNIDENKIDIDSFPRNLWAAKIETWFDKTAIKEYLHEGNELPGVWISKKPFVVVK